MNVFIIKDRSKYASQKAYWNSKTTASARILPRPALAMLLPLAGDKVSGLLSAPLSLLGCAGVGAAQVPDEQSPITV